MGKGFREKYPYTQFSELVSREQSALGSATERIFVSSTPYLSPPGAAKGAYRQYVYRSRFAGETRNVYESIWLYAQDGHWVVSGFYTFTKTEAGQFVPYEPAKKSDI